MFVGFGVGAMKTDIWIFRGGFICSNLNLNFNSAEKWNLKHVGFSEEYRNWKYCIWTSI